MNILTLTPGDDTMHILKKVKSCIFKYPEVFYTLKKRFFYPKLL